MKSKEKGDLALGQAIAYYTKQGCEILLPIGDKKKYDFVIDRNGNLFKVQVKYSGFKDSGGFAVPLKVMGGNRSSGNNCKKYKKGDFDIFFVYTSDGTTYEIPYDVLEGKSSIIVGKKYQKYLAGESPTLVQIQPGPP